MSISRNKKPISWLRVSLRLLAGGLIIAFFLGLSTKDVKPSLAESVSWSYDAMVERLTFSSEPAPPPAPTLTTWSTASLTPISLHPVRESAYSSDLQDLLHRFVVRQGVDDNFTLRIYDDRSGEVLEVFELDSTRQAFHSDSDLTWADVDQQRRQVTKVLLDKWEAAGIPRDELSVRWGRANQVRKSFERKSPYQLYELRLARWLDLSLLVSQITTVETFSQNDLVSPSGARSTYQLMPFLLRQYDIHRYSLTAENGNYVSVREARHPLIVMKPALTIVRGYANAVGHEIPGLSAYHSGPGNVFEIYRRYLINHQDARRRDDLSVLDAYLWGLTDGFPEIRRYTSFGHYSRGYVPALFGSLEAVDNMPMDTSRTLRVERVQLREKQHILLRDLLSLLHDGEHDLYLPNSIPDRDVVGLYKAFRRINPHIDLPPPSSEDIPAAGNINLTSKSRGHNVQFFLPRGSAAIIEQDAPGLLNEKETEYFDPSTYQQRHLQTNRTRWDQAYTDLVDHIQQFGFTRRARQQLDTIVVHLQDLAEQTPTPYRKAQAEIASIHQRLWNSRPWRRLANTISALDGSYVVTPRPLELPSTLSRSDPLHPRQIREAE